MREFASRIRTPRAVAAATGETLKVVRLGKASWQVALEALAPDALVDIEYEAFAYSEGIHDAWLDHSRGFINPAALFLFPEGLSQRMPVTIAFDAPGYRILGTLDEVVSNDAAHRSSLPLFKAESIERFFDSPWHLLSQSECAHVFDVLVCGVVHRILITGVPSINVERIRSDLARLFETIIRFWDPEGRAPFDRYLLSLHLAPELYGGLEHAEGTVLLHDPRVLPAAGEETPPKDYDDFLTLVSHEYFHAWLVKRIHPKAFVPYDLTREAYTTDLWLFEGFTSYYEGRLALDAGVIDRKEWLKGFNARLNAALTREGFDRMSLTESSMAAWVKLYRQSADSPYSQTSYYSKGALLAFILESKIRSLAPDRSLDDVMRGLYGDYLRSTSAGTYAGLTPDALVTAIHRHTGCDLAPLIQILTEKADASSTAHDVWRAELKAALDSHGLVLAPDPDTPAALRLAGIRYANTRDDGKIVLQYVPSTSPAFQAGLFAGDELIAIDGERTTVRTVNRQIERLRGRSAEILWFRGHRIERGVLDLSREPEPAFLERLPQKIEEKTETPL